MHDVVASVVPLATLLLTRGMVPEKCALSIRCHAFVEGSKAPISSTTEIQDALGEVDRWFEVALQIPEDAVEAMVYCCISPKDSPTHVTEIAVAKVDLQTLRSTGRLRMLVDPASPELKLVICPRESPSPLEQKLIINPLQCAYAYPKRNTILREICGEVKFGYSVPAEFLRLQIDRLVMKITQFSDVVRAARHAQGLFSTDKEAVENGYYPCAIRIVGCRSLEQTQRLPGSKTLSSPFVSVSIKSPRFQYSKQVGRTNTEYRTADPVFGTNSNLSLAEHAKPITEFEPGRFGRICSDGIWIETYIREGESLQFVVFHERHSVYQGITNSPMCFAEIPFSSLAGASDSNVQEIDLKNCESPNVSGGKLFVVAFTREQPSTNPFDLVSTNENGEIVDNASIQTQPNLLRIPTYWLSLQIAKMYQQMETLNVMYVETVQRRSSDEGNGKVMQRCFKSSNDKKKLRTGAITTNLHQCDFSVASTQAPFDTRSRFAYTTCGVPSALSLGVDDLNTSLFVLQKNFQEALDQASIHEVSGLEEPLRNFDLVSLSLDHGDHLLAHGSEAIMATCPLTPPCTKPRLNVDETCGCSFHRPHSKLSTSSMNSSGTKATSNTLRTAAASIASKFTSSQSQPTLSTAAPVPSAHEKKPVPPAKWQVAVEIGTDLFLRETVAVSQALAPTASAFISEALLTLKRGPADAKTWGEQILKAGFLVGWESLVSTHGQEMCMLSDVIGVVDYMNSNCVLVCRATDDASQELTVHIRPSEEDGKTQSVVQIEVQFSLAHFDQLFSSRSDPASNSVKVNLVVVLFSQGVNETQSLSNYINKEWASKQAEINRASVERLVKYSLQFNKTVPLPVLRLNAIVENQREDEKEVDVLLLAEDAVRSLRGARQVMCKSGKDRTAMAVTLEQSRVGASSLGDSATVLKVANLMREYGVRIRIAEKNVGRKMYSFNMIQRLVLPKDYRPPVTVIQDMATSYSKKDS